MGIANTFTFGGVSTSDYGLVVEGSGDYSAPKRATETINIPGRNGAFQLDKGYYENIEIEYKVVVADATQADFNDTIEAFRNAIVSQIGYQRLEDTYHPGEYRMATYNGGLNDAPTFHGKGAIFKIKFNCKPQRWLTSGETEVTVTSGDTLTNPTLFESGPLLEATGNGTIQFNGYEIDFAGIPYGEIVICPDSYAFHNLSDTVTVTLDTSLLNSGDAIYPEVKDCYVIARLENSASASFLRGSIGATSNVLEATSTSAILQNKKQFLMYLYPDFGDGFVYGTSKTIVSSAVYNYRLSGTDYSETVGVTITYGGADTYTVKVTSTGTLPSGVSRKSFALSVPTMYGDSTQLIQGVPIYIDCDLGEAYLINGTEYVSLNHRIDLGSDLPKLASGSNTVTFDNTITELKIQPRWWKV